jgi:hypothetical protein
MAASMAIIDKLPAIAYTTEPRSELWYARFDGVAWRRDVVERAPKAGSFVSLAEISGEPAVAFLGGSNPSYLRFARFDGTLWRVEDVDPDGGAYASLAQIDDQPAIAYRGNGSLDGDLRYASLDGESWQVEIVDSVGNVGRDTSLAQIDGQPAISYFDSTDGRSVLKFAQFDGVEWRVETVANRSSGGSGGNLSQIEDQSAISYTGIGGLIYSRLLDGQWIEEVITEVAGAKIVLKEIFGRPAILYLEDSAEEVLTIRLARFDGVRWRLETVATDALRAPMSLVEHGIEPVIAYFGLNSSTSIKELRFASLDQTTDYSRTEPRANAGRDLWANDASGDGITTAVFDGNQSIDIDGEIVDYTWIKDNLVIAEGPTASADLARGFHTITLVVTDDEGESSSNEVLAAAVHTAPIDDFPPIQTSGPVLIGGQPAVFFGAGFNARYARFNGISWVTTHLAFPSFISAETDRFSLVDMGGQPGVAQGPRFSFLEGSVWQTVVVDPASTSVGDQSIGLVNGRPAIAYIDFDDNEVNYAVFDGIDWQITTVDADGAPRNPSLTVINGVPFLAYDAQSPSSETREIRRAQLNVVQWLIDTVDTDGREPSIAQVGASGVSIAFRGDSTGHIKYATFDGMEWRTEIVDGNVFSPPILADVEGQPAIAYLVDERAIHYAWIDGDNWQVAVLIEDEDAITNLGLDSFGDKPMISFEAGHAVRFLTTADGNFSKTTPVADAGDDQLICETDGGGSEEVALDGGRTRDVDGDLIDSFIWTDAGGNEIATGATPVLTLPLGVHRLTLTASDRNGNSTSDQVVVIVATAPIADAGPDQLVIDPEADGTELVQLNGAASSDADGTILSYEWFRTFGDEPIATGPSPSLIMSAIIDGGVHQIRLEITDNDGCTDEDTVVVEVKPLL